MDVAPMNFIKRLFISRWRLRDWVFGYDYFISYSHKDGSDYAVNLREALSNNGFKVCLDRTDFHDGASLSWITRRRIRNSKYLIVIGRKFALTESKWVPVEIDEYLQKYSDPSDSGPIVMDFSKAVDLYATSVKGSLAHRIAQADWLRIP